MGASPQIRVSTLIPVYNGAATIAQAVDSALAQSADGHEVIVANDRSTDTTASVLAGYGSRIRVIEEPANRGTQRRKRRESHSPRNGGYTARNTAAKTAKGRFFAFLDADDIWLPGRLAETCTALENNPKAVLAFSDVIPMDANGNLGDPWVVGKAPSLDDLLAGGCAIYPSAVTVRSWLYEKCGGFDASLPHLADYDFWLRAREYGEFIYVPKPLTIYRTADYTRLGDKYMSGYRPLIAKTRRRHGEKARSLQVHFARVLSSSLVAKANAQINNRAPLAAASTLLRALYLSPPYFAESGLLFRIFRFQNLWRVLRGTPQRTIEPQMPPTAAIAARASGRPERSTPLASAKDA